jgi:hypothetical protein
VEDGIEKGEIGISLPILRAYEHGLFDTGEAVD